MDVRFRPLVRADFALLAGWIAAPTWPRGGARTPTVESVEAAYGPAVDGADPTEMFIVELDGAARRLRPALPRSRTTPTGARPSASSAAAGIDYLIGVPELTGVGLGPAMVELVHRPDLRALPRRRLRGGGGAAGQPPFVARPGEGRLRTGSSPG